jgi:hypothetical protein
MNYKSNSLKNLVLGIAALGAIATSCKSTKDFESYHANVPQSTIENFDRDTYTFKSLSDLIKEEADSTKDNTHYKTVSIDLTSTGYTPIAEQTNPKEFLLRLAGSSIEATINEVSKEEENEFYRMIITDKGIDASSGYHITRGDLIRQGSYNLFETIEDEKVQGFEKLKVGYMIHMFESQLNGENIKRKALEECSKITPTQSSSYDAAGSSDKSDSSGSSGRDVSF